MNSETWKKYLSLTAQEDKLEVHKPNHDIINIFVEHVPPKKYPLVLEIGAGAGVDMHEMQKKGYSMVGIGAGKKNLAHAREKFNIVIHPVDMHEMPFLDGTFNGIISIQTFEHSISPLIAILEMNRVLKIGGRVFIDVPDARDDSPWQVHHPTLLYPEQLIKLFEMHGFKTVFNFSRKHRTQVLFEKVK